MADEIKPKPTQKEMREFLENHFRYWTMNSWNRSSSFARNVKLHRLENVPDNAYDMLNIDEAWDDVRWIQEQFQEEHSEYSIGSNGRSSGYMVLYHQNYPGRSLEVPDDEEEDVEWLYDLVKDFDDAVQQCVDSFLEFCRTHEAVEETIMVPTKITVVKEKAG